MCIFFNKFVYSVINPQEHEKMFNLINLFLTVHVRTSHK